MNQLRQRMACQNLEVVCDNVRSVDCRHGPSLSLEAWRSANKALATVQGCLSKKASSLWR